MQSNYIELAPSPNWSIGLILATLSCNMESNVLYSLNNTPSIPSYECFKKNQCTKLGGWFSN
jgi:hypothetical protein